MCETPSEDWTVEEWRNTSAPLGGQEHCFVYDVNYSQLEPGQTLPNGETQLDLLKVERKSQANNINMIQIGSFMSCQHFRHKYNCLHGMELRPLLLEANDHPGVGPRVRRQAPQGWHSYTLSYTLCDMIKDYH